MIGSHREPEGQPWSTNLQVTRTVEPNLSQMATEPLSPAIVRRTRCRCTLCHSDDTSREGHCQGHRSRFKRCCAESDGSEKTPGKTGQWKQGGRSKTIRWNPGRWGLSSVERWTSDVARGKLDVGSWTLVVRTLDVRGWTLKVGRRASNVRRWTLEDVGRWTLYFGCWTLDVGRRRGGERSCGTP